jgi:hypothetical protein
VGRLAAIGFNALRLHGFDRLREPLLMRLEFFQNFALIDYDVVQFVVKMFKVRKMGLNFLQSAGSFIVHNEISKRFSG